MKMILVLMFIILTNTYFFSQKLNFNDLKYILQHDVESVDSYIGKKMFLFIKADNKNKCIWWAYNYNKSIGDEQNIEIIKDGSGFVLYQFFNQKLFEEIKSYCKKANFKYTFQEIDDKLGELCHTHTSAEFEITFCSALNSKGTNIYTITLSGRTKKII